MLEAVKVEGQWRLRLMRAMGVDRYKHDDDGNMLIFATKKDAERGRRDVERDMTGIHRKDEDYYADREIARMARKSTVQRRRY